MFALMSLCLCRFQAEAATKTVRTDELLSGNDLRKLVTVRITACCPSKLNYITIVTVKSTNEYIKSISKQYRITFSTLKWRG